MRYAILADIHSNLEAFEAVLQHIGNKGGFDQIWCLGDIVGYGPDPVECIRLLRQYDHFCVAGNHDWAAAGKMDTSEFNPVAAWACNWTTDRLPEPYIEYLNKLPETIVLGDFTLVHGSPHEPIWEYITSARIAEDNFSYFETPYCLVGHSHRPRVFELANHVISDSSFTGDIKLLSREKRLIINPGGVGQPRDGDPRASYAIYDSEARAIYHYRVEYDLVATQKKMEERGLPLPLSLRLNEGW